MTQEIAFNILARGDKPKPMPNVNYTCIIDSFPPCSQWNGVNRVEQEQLIHFWQKPRFCISNALFCFICYPKNAKSADKLVSAFFWKKLLMLLHRSNVAIALTGGDTRAL